MFRYALRLRIAAPPSRVFEYLSDPGKLSSWIGGLESTIALEPGPPSAGSRYRQVLLIAGTRQTAERELTDFDPDRRLAFRITAPAISIESTFDLTDADVGTDLAYAHSGETKGLAGAILGKTIQRELASKIEEDLRSLKRIVETPGESAG